MKILKKDNIIPLICISLIIVIVMSIFSSILIHVQNEKYNTQLNKSISKIISIINQKYPNVEEDVIKEILSSDDSYNKKGKEILSKYGIDISKEIAVSNINEEAKNIIKLSISLIIITSFILLITFIVYLKLRDKKITEITTYLKDINNKNYQLKIEENTEGELSELQNEIYKITIMLKEQSEQLKKDKEELSNALSDISHQIKTPLTSISVMIDILKENKNIDINKRHEFIKEISRQLDWINWLVISLLKLSRLDAGTVILKRDSINIAELLNEIRKNLSISLEIKNQKLCINGDRKINFNGDYNWLKEAITNIVKNCIEHTAENKDIKIEYEENSLYLEIEITDEGNGIEKNDLPHIFERFYKGKNSSKDSIGIGLALSKSIIEKQDGNISVKSKIGEGTQFRIQFYK